MKFLSISIEEARTLALKSQGLLVQNAFGAGKKGTLRTIEHLGYIQIDTIAVIERAHHHTLWSRQPDYQSCFLDELQFNDRQVFEYWSHAASYLPYRDYRFTLPRKQAIAKGERHWFGKDPKMMRYVLDRVKREGPLRSKDFDASGKKGGIWYEWKPAKRALEQLFMEGQLMVAKRQGFQKVYDLTERVVPSGTDTSMPRREEFLEYLIQRAITANGLVSIKEIAYLRRGIKEALENIIRRMVKEGKIVPVKVEGIDDPFYIFEKMLQTPTVSTSADQLHLLSPFDNSLIQRKRIEQFFHFNFQIECYVPESKRVYGYFCLPILLGQQFIGRMDPKADRASKTFFIRKLMFEPGIKKSSDVLALLASKISELAAFNQCNQIRIESTEPRSIQAELKRLLK